MKAIDPTKAHADVENATTGSGSSGSVLSFAHAGDSHSDDKSPVKPEDHAAVDSHQVSPRPRRVREPMDYKNMAPLHSFDPSVPKRTTAMGMGGHDTHHEPSSRKRKAAAPAHHAHAPGAHDAPIKPPPVGPGGRVCLHCHTQKTPLWRNGPLGPKTLCNACGVRFKLGKLQPNPNSSIPPHMAAAAMQNVRVPQRKRPATTVASPSKRRRTSRRSSSDEEDGFHHMHVHRHHHGEPVCATCEDGCDDEGEEVAICQGLCGRAFHSACLSPADAARFTLPGEGPGWKCSDCRRQVHECFHCKGRDADRLLRRCSAGGCSKFYHPECLEDLPLASVEGAGRLVCPLHACSGCGEGARAHQSTCCVRCPRAFHHKCLPGGARQVTAHAIICDAHAGGGGAGGHGGGGLRGGRALFVSGDFSDHGAALLLMALAGY